MPFACFPQPNVTLDLAPGPARIVVLGHSVGLRDRVVLGPVEVDPSHELAVDARDGSLKHWRRQARLGEDDSRAALKHRLGKLVAEPHDVSRLLDARPPDAGPEHVSKPEIGGLAQSEGRVGDHYSLHK
jgi:hypothetical protein